LGDHDSGMPSLLPATKKMPGKTPGILV